MILLKKEEIIKLNMFAYGFQKSHKFSANFLYLCKHFLDTQTNGTPNSTSNFYL